MKKTKIITAALSLATVLSVAGCGGDKTVESLVIESGLDYTYVTGSDYSFEDVKVKVNWNDGSVTYVGENDLTISEFSTANAGTKKVTFSYKGKSVIVELRVTNSADEVYQVDYFGKPANMNARAGNLAVSTTSDTGFNIQNNIYVVGDDNDFKFRPVIKLLDPNTQVATTYDDYTSSSTIYRKVGNEFIELKDSNTDSALKLSTYVNEINEKASSYDFTEAAIGETFKLVVKPKYFPIAANGSEHKQELVFKVVDGYNVHEEAELGIMNNLDNPYENEKPTAINTVSAMTNFLRSRGILEEEENIPNVKGIVLHDNLELEVSDLPSEYFVIDSDTQVNYGLKDWMDLYAHYTKKGENFTLHGNYFTIDTSRLPLVAPKDKTGADGFSHTQLFRIKTDPNNFTYANEDKATGTFQNVGFIGNAPNTSGDNVDSSAGLRGLMLFRVDYHEFTMHNMWLKDFYIGGKANGSGTVLNLDNYKSTNAFQGHIFAWGQNYTDYLSDRVTQQSQYDASDKTTPIGPVVNVINSVLKSAGGPAIMAQHDLVSTDDYDDNAYPIINVDETSTINTKLYGGEAWFVAVPFAGQSMGDMKLLIAGLQGATDAAANVMQSANTTFIISEGQTQYLNLHTVAMIGDSESSGYTDDLNGVINIGDATQALIRYEEFMQNPMLNAAIEKGAPIITSSKGGALLFDGKTFVALTEADLNTELVEKFVNTEYLYLFVAGLMTVLKPF